MSKTFSLFVFGLKKCLFIRTTAISRLVHFYSMPHLFPSTPMFENRKICSSIWNEQHLNFLYLILLNFGVLKRFVERVHLPLAFCCLNTDNHLSFCLHMYTTHSVHNLHSWVNLKYPQCIVGFRVFVSFSFHSLSFLCGSRKLRWNFPFKNEFVCFFSALENCDTLKRRKKTKPNMNRLRICTQLTLIKSNSQSSQFENFEFRTKTQCVWSVLDVCLR